MKDPEGPRGLTARPREQVTTRGVCMRACVCTSLGGAAWHSCRMGAGALGQPRVQQSGHLGWWGLQASFPLAAAETEEEQA